jgi:hypothetical protein
MRDIFVRNLPEIEDALREDVVVSQERLKRAVQRLMEVVNDNPESGSSLCISNHVADKRAALDDLATALQRWNAFVFDGVIPDDLIEPPKKQ